MYLSYKRVAFERNFSQHSVITQMGKELEKEQIRGAWCAPGHGVAMSQRRLGNRTCMSGTESRYCTPDTNATLLISYTPTQSRN